jgi:ketosteroid isomerase-like protein
LHRHACSRRKALTAPIACEILASRWLEDWGAAWADWSIEPDEFIDAGNAVVIFIRMKAEGRGSGIEVDRQDALVYEIRDGMVTCVDYYNDRKQALQAAGLSE